MLNKNYSYVNNTLIKSNNNDVDMIIYNSLNDFINDYKQYYSTSKQLKYNIDVEYDFTFNEIFNEFISYYLYELNINKNDFVTILKFDDYIIIYTKNQKFEYHFYE